MPREKPTLFQFLVGIAAIVACIAAVLVVPEFRKLIGLEPYSSRAPTPTQYKITLPANIEWLDTRIEIRSGQNIQISATGSINLKDGLIEADSPTPDGQENTACHPWPELNIGNCLINDAAAGVLVGKIGSGNIIQIGKNLEFTASESGILFLAVNDNIGYFRDNLGVYTIEIKIR